MESLNTLIPMATDWPEVQYSLPLLGVIFLAGVGTTILFFISAIAFLQRRTTQYLLIMAALSALALQSVIGAGTVFGVVPMIAHHLIEHTLDFLIAALVLYAVYRNGPSTRHQTSIPSEE
jgi:hypothetical protein